VKGLPERPQLRPVFRTEITRSRLTLAPIADAKVELALDDGAIIAGNRSEPVSELELELKHGPQQALFRLGLDLVQVAPLALFGESKAERGDHLLNGTRPEARKAPPVELEAGLSLTDAFRQLAEQVLASLLANQPAALRGDEQEGVHEMRIAIRRLRSLLVLFERHLEPHARERFEEELRRLGAVLGAARDWDVFLADTLPMVLRAGADLDWIEPLRAVAVERRHAAHSAAKKAVLDAAFTRFVLAFHAWGLSGGNTLAAKAHALPLEHAAPGMLTRLARKVERRLDDSDKADAASLHRLRKSAKKLRYGVEYLQSLYGKPAKAYYKRCNALQKRLGDINDLSTLVSLATELARDRVDLAPALGILAERGESLLRRELKGLPKRVERFTDERPFWV
jgi:inorganic triphosphatase YgiF